MATRKTGTPTLTVHSKGSSALHVYKSYLFTDKDPVIDKVRTLIDDQKITYAKIEAEGGPKATTLWGWFRGDVKRPQFATICAAVRTLGHDIQIVPRRAGQSRYSVTSQRPRLRVVGGSR